MLKDEKESSPSGVNLNFGGYLAKIERSCKAENRLLSEDEELTLEQYVSTPFDGRSINNIQRAERLLQEYGSNTEGAEHD
jgi:hypothetical protein